jgi:hypothetical protein
MSFYHIGNVQAGVLGLARRAAMLKSKSGLWFFGASLAMAFVSLAFAPGVFGTLGILMGMAAVVKGERYLGMLGVVASAVLGVTGYYFAGALVG